MISKIILMIIIVIVISSTIFITTMFLITKNDVKQQNLEKNFYQNDVKQQNLEKNFYQNDTTVTRNKIFLFGSSHINALNTTQIDKKLHNEGFSDFSVYNLAFNSDSPSRRLNAVDMVISTKPQVVVYGIDMRSFVEYNTESIQNENKLLPDPQKNLKKLSNIFGKNIPFDFSFLSSPKLSILTLIRTLFQEPHEPKSMEFSPYPNAPTVLISQKNMISKTDEQLKHTKTRETLDQLREPEINKEVIALKQIIERFKQNNIKIIIFTTPYHKYYGEYVKYKIESFNNIIQSIENDSDLKIYRLDDKYQDIESWTDLTHIAINKNSTRYNEDVANIILSEIKQ